MFAPGVDGDAWNNFLGITVNQHSVTTKGELTGVNARNLDPSSLPKTIEVTQKVDTVEGTVTGVDLSKKTQQGK